MTTSQKATMYQQIEKHGNSLNAIFNTGIDSVKLCKNLRKLEIKAAKLATDYCNGENGVDTENWELKCAPILAAVRKLLFVNGMTNTPLDWCIFINGDARGYSLKISDKYVRENKLNIYTDWGGYGIICPDFTPNN